MDLRSAARALGGEVSRQSVLCPGPGHSPRDRSLEVTFGSTFPDGFAVRSFAGDDWQDCKDHVRTLLGIGDFKPSGRAGERTTPSQVKAMPRQVEPDASAVSRTEYAMSIWKEARPIAGTAAETYLAARGIDIPGEIYTGQAIRFHPACPFRLDSGETARLPAMIAAMVAIEGNAFQGVHRTALQPNGSGKAVVRGLDDPRKMLGSAGGAVVKLSPDDAVTMGLGIGEGLETCMSVMGNLGFSPVWSTLSAGTLGNFPVLSGIETITIFADRDQARTLTNGKVVYPGQDAARKCGLAWTEAGREAVIWTPPELTPDKGADFNDLIGQGVAA